MDEEKQNTVIQIVSNCSSANDIRDLVFIEALVLKKRLALEQQFGVKTHSRSFFGIKF